MSKKSICSFNKKKILGHRYYFSRWKIYHICELIVPCQQNRAQHRKQPRRINNRHEERDQSGHPFCNGNWHFFSEAPRVIAQVNES